MSQTESHAVRNGIIATVLGGLILTALGSFWPPLRQAFAWSWGLLKSLFSILSSNHLVPGWILLLLATLSAVLIVRLVLAVARSVASTDPHSGYTSDSIYGALWHWTWSGQRISNLWASCPQCQGELVYVNERDSYLMSSPRAKFFCEHCQKVVVEIQGGGQSYSEAAVEREIRRRIRVSDAQKSGLAS